MFSYLTFFSEQGVIVSKLCLGVMVKPEIMKQLIKFQK